MNRRANLQTRSITQHAFGTDDFSIPTGLCNKAQGRYAIGGATLGNHPHNESSTLKELRR